MHSAQSEWNFQEVECAFLLLADMVDSMSPNSSTRVGECRARAPNNEERTSRQLPLYSTAGGRQRSIGAGDKRQNSAAITRNGPNASARARGKVPVSQPAAAIATPEAVAISTS